MTIHLSNHAVERWSQRIGDGDPAEALREASIVPRKIPVRLRGKRVMAMYSKAFMAMFLLARTGTKSFTAMTVWRPNKRWLLAFHHRFA